MNPTINLEDIYSPVETQLASVHDCILELLSGSNLLSKEVIHYFFSSQGKLLRPGLTFLGAAAAGERLADDTPLLKVASSFEIFHAATLIHDDIIDSAHLRRSIPAINVKFGPDVAVLVGDYLHDKAIGTIFENGTQDIFSLFLKTAGTVCDGEIQELKERRNFDLPESVYLEIIEKKTASLLGCSVKAGGLMAGLSDEQGDALQRFGTLFGMAFQIIDDCLDFTGEVQEFGKTLGTDCAEGVLTLPVIRLLQTADNDTRKKIEKAFSAGHDAGHLQTLLELIREHDTISYALAKAAEFSDKARRELEIFPDTPGRRSLELLVDYVLDRNK